MLRLSGGKEGTCDWVRELLRKCSRLGAAAIMFTSCLHSHQVAGMRLDHNPDALARAKLESIAGRQR